MIELYTVAELRKIEERTVAELPPGTLMQRAGREAAELALNILSPNETGARVLILAGPGNNGGDGMEMAIVLAEHDVDVSVLQISSPRRQSDTAKLSKERAVQSGIRFEGATSTRKTIESLANRTWDLIVDGLFGIGITEPLTGNYYLLANIVNDADCPVLALDVPSGLNPDTGSVIGKDGIAIRADATITFLGNKPGLYTNVGRDYAGSVHVVRLGAERHGIFPQRWLNHPSLFSVMLRRRRHDSHKGTFGQLAVIGGADGMSGAPVLAARAALHCGAGLIYVIFQQDTPKYHDIQPELMYRTIHGFDFSTVTSVMGPGLGVSPAARNLVHDLLRTSQPLVLDADALNAISEETELQQLLEDREGPSLLTPHPLEAARLLNTTTHAVQFDRQRAAAQLASRFGATVVLKGSGTVIADPDGKIAINPTGGPALATPGSGDVLAGICGALLAQNWPTWEAALASVWMHGVAADELVRSGEGPIGLTAGELIPQIRRVMNRLIYEYDRNFSG